MGVPTVTLAGDSIVSRYSLTYQAVAEAQGLDYTPADEMIAG